MVYLDIQKEVTPFKDSFYGDELLLKLLKKTWKLLTLLSSLSIFSGKNCSR